MKSSALMRYVVYAVDAFGVANATYELECPTDDEAMRRARKFLVARHSDFDSLSMSG